MNAPLRTIAPPRYLQIEPVGQCNLRCRMCPIQFRQDGPPWGPPAFMEFSLFTRLVDEFPALEHLHLQGLGEPLMHPRFFDMVGYAAAKGIKVTTNTNLTLLDPRRAERCAGSGLAELHVSLDGATATTFEGIRVRARLARVLKNLDRLMEARRRCASRKPEVHVVMVVMRRNLGELADLVELVAHHGVGRVFVQHLCHDYEEPGLPAAYRPMQRFVQEETLLNADSTVVHRHFRRAREKAEELHVDLRLPSVRPRQHAPDTPGPERCDWPWRGAYVSYDGMAMPCCMISTPDRANFGRVSEDGMGRLWHGEAYQDFRKRLDSDDPPDVCRSCAVYRGTF